MWILAQKVNRNRNGSNLHTYLDLDLVNWKVPMPQLVSGRILISTTCSDTCAFMSPKTFITLFFSYVCAMKILGSQLIPGGWLMGHTGVSVTSGWISQQQHLTWCSLFNLSTKSRRGVFRHTNESYLGRQMWPTRCCVRILEGAT